MIGLLVLLPGLLLAAGAGVYLSYAHAVCDPLYGSDRLYDMSEMKVANDNVYLALGGSFEPPPRPSIRLNPDLRFAPSCR